MTEEVKSYKCNWCNALYDNEHRAIYCAFEHAKENLANSMLNMGYNLQSINSTCGFNWNLCDEHKVVTKDNCFAISHWQCSDKPAYTIFRISTNGVLKLGGCGNWSGWYSDDMRIDRLPKEYFGKDKLFVYEDKRR